MERTYAKMVRRISIAAALLMVVAGVSLAEDSTGADNSGSLPTERHSLHLNDAWIDNIGSLLYSDFDGDGYFSGLGLTIDADTSFNAYEVYLVVDIVDEFNLVENLISTRPFYIYGRSFTDEYRIDIDLLQNYFPGVYDLQVTLVDAHDNRILDYVNARDFSNLRSLPLESEDNQSINAPVAERPINAPNDDVRVREYAGSTGFGILLTLLAGCVFRVFTVNASRLKR